MMKKENNIMMLLIVGSESIFFISLIMGYLYFWRSGHFAAAVRTSLDLRSTACFTFLLLCSSGTYRLAEHYHKKGQHRNMSLWLLATILLGVVFLTGQGHEYDRLLRNNVRMSSSLFGTTFYTLTGFHGLHVVIGIVLLIILFILALQGFFDKRSTLLGTIGIYWHFVDLVWLAVFTIVYVVPYLI